MKEGTAILVHVGERTTQNGKRRYAYVEIPEDLASKGIEEPTKLEWQDADETWFGKKILTPSRPGTVIKTTWEVKDDGDGIMSYKPESVIGFWADINQVIGWDTKDRATRSARADANEDKREARRNLMKESIEPIREAYARASTAERQQILAAAIRYITTGR